MRLPLRLVLPAAGLALLAGLGMPAGAEPVCTGTEEDAKICVDPDALPNAGPGDGEPATRCVYVPTEAQCRKVTLPVAEPVVDPGRPEDVVTCTGQCAKPVEDAAEPLVEKVESIRQDAVEEHERCYTGVGVRRVARYLGCMVKPTGPAW